MPHRSGQSQASSSLFSSIWSVSGFSCCHVTHCPVTHSDSWSPLRQLLKAISISLPILPCPPHAIPVSSLCHRPLTSPCLSSRTCSSVSPEHTDVLRVICHAMASTCRSRQNLGVPLAGSQIKNHFNKPIQRAGGYSERTYSQRNPEERASGGPWKAARNVGRPWT